MMTSLEIHWIEMSQERMQSMRCAHIMPWACNGMCVVCVTVCVVSTYCRVMYRASIQMHIIQQHNCHRKLHRRRRRRRQRRRKVFYCLTLCTNMFNRFDFAIYELVTGHKSQESLILICSRCPSARTMHSAIRSQWNISCIECEFVQWQCDDRIVVNLTCRARTSHTLCVLCSLYRR